MATWLATFDPIARWAATRLVDGSLQGALLIALVWMVSRLVSMPPRVRAVLWWIASAKLALSFLPLPALPIRVLPAPEAIRPPASRGAQAPPSAMETFTSQPSATPDEEHRSRVGHTQPGGLDDEPQMELSVVDALIGCWFVIILAHVAALAVSSRRAGRFVVTASSLSTDEAGEVVAIASRLDMRRVPRVMVSGQVTSPQAIGAWHPAILLPVDFAQRVTPDEWRMAVCHELMHVRRRDLLWGWIPALAERLFFFHPLAHLASERYLLAREAACDAAVLHALDVDAHQYGRMLVRLGVSRPMPGFAASAGSASSSLLRRRLEMLYQASTTGTTRARWLLAAAAIALLPFQLVAQVPPPAGLAARAPASSQTGSAGRPDRLVVPAAPTAAQRSDASADSLARQREVQAAVEAAQKVARVAAQRAAADAATQREAVEQQNLNAQQQALAARLKMIARQEQVQAQRLSQQAAANASGVGSDDQRLTDITRRIRELAEKLRARQGDTSALDRDMASLNELLQALRMTSAARPTSQATTPFLHEQLAAAKARLDELEAKRSQAQIAAAAAAGGSQPERGAAERGRLAEVQAAVAASQQRLDGLRRQVQEAQAGLAREQLQLRALQEQLEQQKAR
jgi:beta-lactamase regulating signal transducer with metallopeptidase domain